MKRVLLVTGPRAIAPRHEYSESLQAKVARAKAKAQRVIDDQVSMHDMVIVGDAYGIDYMTSESARTQGKTQVVYGAQKGTWNRFCGNTWEASGNWTPQGSLDTVLATKRPLMRNAAMVNFAASLVERKFMVSALGFLIDINPCNGTRHTWKLIVEAKIEGMLVNLSTAGDIK